MTTSKMEVLKTIQKIRWDQSDFPIGTIFRAKWNIQSHLTGPSRVDQYIDGGFYCSCRNSGGYWRGKILVMFSPIYEVQYLVEALDYDPKQQGDREDDI